MKLDITNAYGEVDRAAILRSLRQVAPGLVPLYLASYANNPTLFHSNGTWAGECRRGVKQGDPLATLLFCLAIDGPLGELDSALKDGPCTGAWSYADDILGASSDLEG